MGMEPPACGPAEAGHYVPPTSYLLLCGWPAEVDARDALRFRRRVEHGVFVEAEDPRRDVGRELPARGVVLLHALVVPHPLDREPVLGARELVHQPVERLVRPQLRVIL